MVVVSYSGKEINAKLVYYGAGLSGKTTNLEAIYEAVPDTSRGKMVSMKTQSDRTLFFDLLPLDLGEIMGFKTRFLLYTVPGQVFYNATRKLVLKGADAIVFVADSEVGKMEENKESLANLRANLAEYSVQLDSIPWVLQYNKRDLPNVYSIDELNAEMNPGNRVPWFEACAREGKGVFETFRGISHLLMEKVTKDLRRTPSPAPRAAAAAAAAAGPALEPESGLLPAQSVRSSAPPTAPVQAIAHEAATTPAPAADGGRIDYGREIELPGAFSGTPVNRIPEPQPVSVAASVPAAQPQPQPAASQPAPIPMAAPSPAPAMRVDTGAPAGASVTPLVVPVRLAPGAAYEIVLRIEVDKAA